MCKTQADIPGRAAPVPAAPLWLSEGCWGGLFGQTLPHIPTFPPSPPDSQYSGIITSHPGTRDSKPSSNCSMPCSIPLQLGTGLQHFPLPTFVNGLIPKELLSATWCRCSIVLGVVTKNESQAPSFACPQHPQPPLQHHLRDLDGTGHHSSAPHRDMSWCTRSLLLGTHPGGSCSERERDLCLIYHPNFSFSGGVK